VKNSQSGAGGIDKDPMETRSFGEGKGLSSIPFHDLDHGNPQAMTILLDEPKFAAHEVQGENLTAILHELGQMGGFSARSCAGVQDTLSGLGFKEEGDHLR
jgi:hypothetical protein